MTPPVRIRPFSPDDRDAVVLLWDRCGLVVPWNHPHRDIERKLAVDADLFLVAENDAGIVGTVMAGYEGHRGWVNYIAVAPELREQSLGRLLMDRVETALADRGCPKVNLQIRRQNRGVITFYRKLGYVIDDVVSMGKRLEPDPPFVPIDERSKSELSAATGKPPVRSGEAVTLHPARAPETGPLLKALTDHAVDFVVIGSVAVSAYGVEVSPGDLDVVPRWVKANLDKLGACLLDLEASPEGLGHWEVDGSGKRRWIIEPSEPSGLAQWRPDPSIDETFDHLFHTRHGNLDVVPDLAGDFEALQAGCETRPVDGVTVSVAGLGDLLTTLVDAKREKDQARVDRLLSLLRERERGRTP